MKRVAAPADPGTTNHGAVRKDPAGLKGVPSLTETKAALAPEASGGVPSPAEERAVPVPWVPGGRIPSPTEAQAVWADGCPDACPRRASITGRR